MHATEQGRPDVLKQRELWFDGQLDLDPEQLIFIDETWASTNMAKRHGRCRRGERLRSGVPHGHWKTTAFVAGLRRTGMVAPMVLDGPINRDAFVAYVRQVLVPDFSPGDVVVMDNLSSHKVPAPREAIGNRSSDKSAVSNKLNNPPIIRTQRSAGDVCLNYRLTLNV